MVTRRPKRKDAAQAYTDRANIRTERQWRFNQSSALPLWVGGNGVGPKASRAAADCHFGWA
eukprot:scaffold232098_cov41-Attheya_sp.AAC.2